MNTEFTEQKNINKDIFNNIDKLKEELYDFKSLFDLEINKLLGIIEIYSNKKGNMYFDNKKLKIAVMGQVNSGKSSFLNSLIFNGENVLPRDCISKTKIITKINYSNTKRLEIEFYSHKEWDDIKNILIKEGGTEGISFVKEIFKFINGSEQELEKYINKNNEIVNFQNYEELLDKIKQYDNKYCNYTFAIKAINIYIDDIRLKNIEIIDTPGVNDLNLIRKYTIDKCLKDVDVIFFLSQAAIFLDNIDIDLITNQIPMESASNVFLIASKYDTAIIDEGWKFKSLFEADEYIKLRLTNRGRKYVSKHINNSIPIFMSSVANNLALKKQDKYSEEENYIINQLNNLWQGYILNKEKLMHIGNFEDIKTKLSDKVDIKENLISKLEAEIEEILCDIKEKSKQRMPVIENTEIKYINIEQENIKLKSQKICKGIEDAIKNSKELATNEKKQVEQQLELDFLTFSDIKVKQKTIQIDREDSKNNVKWYEVFLKKANNDQTDDYCVNYECVEIDEVINNVNNFASNTEIYIKKIIDDSIDLNMLKKNIITVVCENLDENNEKFKPNDVKAFVESAIRNIKLSDIDINVEEYINLITNKFSDETVGEEIEALKLNFKAIMEKIYNEIEQIIDAEFQQLIFQLDKAQIGIMKYILEIMNNRAESLKNELYNLNKKLNSYKKIIRIIDSNV